MPRAIRSMEEVPLNPYEALKRAYIKHGYIPRYFRRSAMGYPTTTEDEAVRPKKSKIEKDNEDIFDVADKSMDVLFECQTIFPFTLVPDTITLDREKLTIAKRLFWRTANITSTPVSEIMSVEANVGPLFGSIHLTFRFFTDNTKTITYLKRQDTLDFQKLLHGYIIAQRKEIDTSHIKSPELKQLLMELGQGASD
jgi:hypothetical protein